MTPGWPSDCRQQARRNQSPTCCWASTEPGSGSRWLRTDLGASSTSPELHFLRVPCSRRDCQAVDPRPGAPRAPDGREPAAAALFSVPPHPHRRFPNTSHWMFTRCRRPLGRRLPRPPRSLRTAQPAQPTSLYPARPGARGHVAPRALRGPGPGAPPTPPVT